jgi:hypothetical protein
MRGRRASGGSVVKPPLNIYSPNSIFTHDVTGVVAAENQEAAKKLANQLNYNRQTYEHWFGYTGPGYAEGTALAGPQPPQTYSPTLWVVPEGQKTQKVTLENDLLSEVHFEELQAAFNNVPVPTLALVPSGSLWTPTGTDKWVAIWQPSTNKYWEMEKMEGAEGEYIFHMGGYMSNVNAWNGIFSNAWMGTRATGLGLFGGALTLQDLIEVLRGGSIKHAVNLNVPAKTGGPVAPATRYDSQVKIPEKIPAGFPKEGDPNPAYPDLDGVAEAEWFRFPPASNPSEYGITLPLGKAYYEAIRKYGMFISDGNGSAPKTNMESAQALGSPYCYATLDPFYGAPAAWGGGSFTWIPSSLKSSALPALTEEPTTVFNEMPFQTLEVLVPRSS